MNETQISIRYDEIEGLGDRLRVAAAQAQVVRVELEIPSDIPAIECALSLEFAYRESVKYGAVFHANFQRRGTARGLVYAV